MDWADFLFRARKRKVPVSGILLALDPGETTGWAVFDSGLFIGSGQRPTPTPLSIAELIISAPLLANNDSAGDAGLAEAPNVVVAEAYRIYGHKLARHSGSDVPTLQLIGGIRLTCEVNRIPLVLQMAWQAKGFCSDAKLKEWGLWTPGKGHANDAARHGAYWLLFGKRPNPVDL